MTFFSQILIIVCLGILLLSGCTKKQLYHTVQETNESRCRLKVGADREQCLAELNKKDYQVYESERKAMVSNKPR